MFYEDDMKKVEKAKKELQKMMTQVQYIVPEYNPFFSYSAIDIEKLRDTVIPMLENYLCVLGELYRGNIVLSPREGSERVYKRNGEIAPAYKSGIDANIIYDLWKNKGMSQREIAKKIGCSPDTVKRRIWEVQYKMEKKEGEEAIEEYDGYNDDDDYDDYYEGFNLDTIHDDYDSERIDSDSEQYGSFWGLSNDINDLLK